LKLLMWKAAKASYPQAWEREMKEIKKVNLEAYKYLMKIPPRHSTRAWFKPNPQCDTLLNNMSEAFNSVIVVPRQKPIVSMMEDIRVYLMERWYKNREKSALYEGGILPKNKKKIAKLTGYRNQWLAR